MWGPPKKQFATMQARFLGREIEYQFYDDMDTQKVVAAIPGPTSRVKHTLGQPGKPIEAHLASLTRIVTY